jgi:hypothetical protein
MAWRFVVLVARQVYCHERVALVLHGQRAVLLQLDVADAPTVSLAEMISRASRQADRGAEALPMLHMFDGVKLLRSHASALLEQPQEQRARAALAYLSDETLSAAAFAAYWDEYVSAHKAAFGAAAAEAFSGKRVDSEGKGNDSGNGTGNASAPVRDAKPLLKLANVHTEADARRYAQQV